MKKIVARKYEPYPAYKDSGVEWLGEIPEGWRVRPVFAMYRRSKRINNPDEELLSVYRDYGVIPTSSREDNFNRPSEDLSTYQLVKPRDLVINKMKAWQGSIAVSEYSGIVSPAYHVYLPSHRENDRYIHYLMRSPLYASIYMRMSKGIRVNQWDLEPESFSHIGLLLPSLSEQRSIIAFLDREISKLDALLAKYQRLLDLLAEKRSALISRAVTKGLDPDAPMKDSGVEWLGEIPEGWCIKKIATLFVAKKGSNAAQLTKEYCASIEGEFPVFSGQTDNGGVLAFIDQYEFDAGESGWLFSTTVGAKAMTIRQVYGRFSLSQNCMVFYSNDSEINTRYCYYHFQPLFAYERGLIPEHMQASFRMEDLYQFMFAVPPIKEQQEIVAYLDRETARIDALAAKVERAMELLREYRVALISAAVTGKIDLREESA